MLEQGARDVLIEAGGGERMQREGMIHEGIYLRSEGETHRIPVTD